VSPKPRIVLGAGALIHRDGKLLLVRRAEEPDLGFWSFPGGMVEVGETTEQAAVREVKEEVGLDIAIERLFGVVTYLPSKGSWRRNLQVVVVDYLAKPVRGRVRLNAESSDWGWFSPAQASRLRSTQQLRRLAAEYSALDRA
jgi:8-oxo-dGTP diphosphatase